MPTTIFPVVADGWLDTHGVAADGVGAFANVGFHQQYQGVFRADFSSLPATALVVRADFFVFVERLLATTPAEDMDPQAWGITAAWTEAGLSGAAPPASDQGLGTALSDAPWSAGAVGVWRSFRVDALVQGWINGTLANNGLMVYEIEDPAGGSNKAYTVTTREGTLANRPYFQVTT